MRPRRAAEHPTLMRASDGFCQLVHRRRSVRFLQPQIADVGGGGATALFLLSCPQRVQRASVAAGRAVRVTV